MNGKYDGSLSFTPDEGGRRTHDQKLLLRC